MMVMFVFSQPLLAKIANFDLSNFYQDIKYNIRNIFHSMANTNMYQSHTGAFFAIFHRFPNIHI